MRLIYADEAGTSALEPVRVVAAVIVHGDKQYRDLMADLARAVEEDVPSALRRDFHIHAKDIYGGGKYREKWSKSERLGFLKRVLSLVQKHKIPVAVACVHKDTFDGHPGLSRSKIRQHELDHIVAFSMCIERADLFLRKYLAGKEIGTVIAEDVPQMKERLRRTALSYREQPFTVPGHAFRQNATEARLGIAPASTTYAIEHIIDAPHFAAKRDAPALQLADACAFAFRRALSRQADGVELLEALLDLEHVSITEDEVWFTGQNSALFNTISYWTPELFSRQNAEMASRRILKPRKTDP